MCVLQKSSTYTVYYRNPSSENVVLTYFVCGNCADYYKYCKRGERVSDLIVIKKGLYE